MNGSDLKHLRAERGLTLRELAGILGDVDASTLSRWEANGHVQIPGWITEKLLTSTVITLPLTELEQILAHARAHGQNFAQLLAAAVHEYLSARAADLASPDTSAPSARARIASPIR